MPFAAKFRAAMQIPFPGDEIAGFRVEDVDVQHRGLGDGRYEYPLRMVLEGKGLDVILGSGAGYSQLPEGELEKLASRVIEQWQAELVSKGKEFQVEVRNPGVVGHLVERGMRESGNRADPERLSWYMERNLGDTCGE